MHHLIIMIEAAVVEEEEPPDTMIEARVEMIEVVEIGTREGPTLMGIKRTTAAIEEVVGETEGEVMTETIKSKG
jgi:hypothetical protein